MDMYYKNLALAELMGWDVVTYGVALPESEHEYRINGAGSDQLNDSILCPYDDLAQFGAIILEYMGVTQRKSGLHTTWANGWEPTQTNILDEILRMKGYKINE